MAIDTAALLDLFTEENNPFGPGSLDVAYDLGYRLWYTFTDLPAGAEHKEECTSPRRCTHPVMVWFFKLIDTIHEGENQ